MEGFLINTICREGYVMFSSFKVWEKLFYFEYRILIRITRTLMQDNLLKFTGACYTLDKRWKLKNYEKLRVWNEISILTECTYCKFTRHYLLIFSYWVLQCSIYFIVVSRKLLCKVGVCVLRWIYLKIKKIYSLKY